MANHIPAETIQEIIARSDIVELISNRIQLKKRGNSYLACCPFHEEKTPSFSVSAEKQFYYCFGCGTSGNVIGFLMAYDRIEFIDAISYLAAQHGIELNYSSGTPDNKTEPQAYETLEKAANYYRKTLRNSPQAINYLKSRQLSGEICQRFAIGYAPAGWDNLQRHFSSTTTMQDLLLTHGLLITKQNGGSYDRFRNRIIFPIFDLRGRVIAFGGRTIGDDQPKYLNSPETPLFHKNLELYGLYQARQANPTLQSILVVEGYLDVIPLHQHQFTNAVATLGTAISTKHVQKLLRYTHNIVFCFDGDSAGHQAAWRALLISLPLLRDGVEVSFLLLSNGEDPDSILRQQGADYFKQLLTQALPLPTYFFQHLQQLIPIESPAGRAHFAKQACEYLDTMPSGIYQHLLYEQLSQLLNINPEQLQRLSQPQTAPSAPTAVPTTSNAAASSLHPAYRAMVLLLHKPELAEATPFEQLRQCPTPEKTLLINLASIIQEKSIQNVGELLAQLQQAEQRKLVSQLAARKLFIPESGIKQEYLGALERLHQLDLQQKINQLIDKAKHIGLNENEKHELQLLLTTKHQKNS